MSEVLEAAGEGAEGELGEEVAAEGVVPHVEAAVEEAVVDSEADEAVSRDRSYLFTAGTELAVVDRKMEFLYFLFIIYCRC